MAILKRKKKKSTKKHLKNAKIKAAHFLKDKKHMIGNLFDSYFLSELLPDEIQNDLGASFTTFERKGNIIIKKAKKKGEEKLIDEINWYLKFKNTEFSKLLPQIIRYSQKKDNVFIEMKYYTYPNMRKLILDGMNATFFLKKRWVYLFDSLLKYLYVEKNSKPTPMNFVKKTHFRKLKNRIYKTLKIAPFLNSVIRKKYLLINNKKYLNIELLSPAIESSPEIIEKLTPEKVYYSHGDLHCNNMLCGILHNNLILLDCRGKSPYGDHYFDVAYDVAKLYHDLKSLYTFIEKHYYSIFLHVDKDVKIEYEFNHQELIPRFEESKKIVDELIKTKFKDFGNLNYRSEFTEAMLFLTMVPFHLKTNSEGLMCYITGIIRLNEWFEKYHKIDYEKLLKYT